MISLVSLVTLESLMKIAIWHNVPSGGGKRALYYHVQGLVERGHVVEAWCPPTSNRDYLPLGKLIQEHVVPLNVRPSRAGQFLKRSKILRNELRSHLLAEVRALDEHCRRCAEEIDQGDFDVLFANSSFIQAVSSIGRHVKTAKALYLQEPSRRLYEASEHGLLWVAIPSVNKPLMKPRYAAWFMANVIGTQQLRVVAREEALNARAYDTVLVNSMFSRESILRAYGIDSRVCYLGVDTTLFVNRKHPRDQSVVSVGELGRHKNARFIIEAVGKLPNPKPRLVWIGNVSEPSYEAEVRQLAEELGVEFELRINVSDDELVEQLNTANVMAYAPRLEPFGFAPLEANACGLPVVAVAEGGVRETIVDGVNGLLVPHEPEAMAAAIERILGDESYADQLGRNGSQIVGQKWSLDSAVDRLERELTRVVAKRKSVPRPS
jgi:glycosyltransferase involved in cell wall biosynthesis